MALPDLPALLDADVAGLQRVRRLLADLPGHPPAELVDLAGTVHAAVSDLETAVARSVVYAPLGPA